MKGLVLLLCLVAATASAQVSQTLSVGGDMFNGNYKAFGITGKIDVKYKRANQYDFAITTTYRNSQQSKYGTSTLIKYEDEVLKHASK